LDTLQIRFVSVTACVCLPDYLSVSNLTVAFLDQFSPKVAQKGSAESKNGFIGVNIAPPLPLFCHQNRHFGPKGPEKPCKHKYANLISALNIRESMEFPRYVGNGV